MENSITPLLYGLIGSKENQELFKILGDYSLIGNDYSFTYSYINNTFTITTGTFVWNGILYQIQTPISKSDITSGYIYLYEFGREITIGVSVGIENNRNYVYLGTISGGVFTQTIQSINYNNENLAYLFRKVIDIDTKDAQQDVRMNNIETKNVDQDIAITNLGAITYDLSTRTNTIELKDITQDSRLNDLENNIAPPSMKGYWASYYDTTTQASNGVVKPVEYNTISYEFGIRSINNNTIVFDQKGVFNVEFSFEVQNLDTHEHTAEIWFRINGIDIPDSNTRITLLKKANTVASWNYIYEAEVGDELQIMWYAPKFIVLVTHQAETNPIRPLVPSTIVTVSQVSYLQKGDPFTYEDFTPEQLLALKGEKGDTGVGVIAGGSAGQVLAKIDGTDYNTQWINNEVGDLATRVTATETKNTEQDSRLTNVESKNTTQDTRLTNIENKNTTQDNSITSLGTRATNLETRATNIESVNTTQDTRLTNVETKNTQQDTRLSKLEGYTILWSGGAYMNATQTINLVETLSEQINGFILIWSAYTNGNPANNNWHHHFVHKYHGILSTNGGMGFPIRNNTGSGAIFASKYLYIQDTNGRCDITGHANNTAGDNSNFVLRYIIGF